MVLRSYPNVTDLEKVPGSYPTITFFRVSIRGRTLSIRNFDGVNDLVRAEYARIKYIPNPTHP